MTIDFTGIYNENEFYTSHYLTALLEDDLKDTFKNWKTRESEQGVRPPYSRPCLCLRSIFRCAAA